MQNKLTVLAMAPFLMGSNIIPKSSPPAPPVIEETPKVMCLGCSPVEQKTAEFFHKEGVEDTKALSVILGAIKQESKFNPLVCEGGALTGYHGCKTGGVGLLQWTYITRYNGLEKFANRTNSCPNSFDTQLKYSVTEVEWKQAPKTFKTTGLAMNSYFHAGHVWLGYGIKGARHNYAYQYTKKLFIV